MDNKTDKLEEILNELFNYKLKISSSLLPKIDSRQKIVEIPEHLLSNNNKLFDITIYYIVHTIVHRDKKIMKKLYISDKIRKHYRIFRELELNTNKNGDRLEDYLNVFECLEIDRTLLCRLSEVDKDIYNWFSKGLKEIVYNSNYKYIYSSAILIQRISPKKVKQMIKELQYIKNL